ncbi:MAG TPA: type IV toxin-antitoxin system AbiEi family antitoxin domain-containing protein [Solirubrobacterales bacterium]|jgi:very-short-patch-repair endonuclease|nr:type IV toxin-antitoxin system AbiEi family antitoxin domain-containing protein [Solirubrobacterales bacterium]
MSGLEQTRALDERIGELAERQHGVVARRQLLALGAGEEAIEVRLGVGRLYRLHRGVYSVGHRVLSREARWMAATLCCGFGAVLSHRTAAAFWGIRGHSSGMIEVTTPSKSRSRGSIQRHFAALPADEVTTTDGIPVTTVPRTLFDLAAVLRVDAVEQALRQSERLRLHDVLSLEDLLARYPRHRGNRAIRECLRRRRELPAGVTREALEARFLVFLARHGLPRPRLNTWITLGPHRYQVDCLWPEQRVIVELDGYETHGTWSAFQSDRDRDRRLIAAGYRSTRVTWHYLLEIPEEIAIDLRTTLAAGSPP